MIVVVLSQYGHGRFLMTMLTLTLEVIQSYEKYLYRTTLTINTLVLVSSSVHQFPERPEGRLNDDSKR